MTPGRHAASDGSFRKSAGAAAGRGIVLLGVAVILGIVLLSATDAEPPGERVTAGSQGDQPDDNGGGEPGDAGVDEPPVDDATTTTTAPLRPPRDVKVLVVNASGGNKVAARVTDNLRPFGYNLLAPGNATPLVDTTSVFFTAGFEREALELAGSLSLPPTSVKPMPQPPPTSTKGANVLVLVGRDVAAQLGPPPSSTTTTARPRRTTSTTAATSSTTTTTTAR